MTFSFATAAFAQQDRASALDEAFRSAFIPSIPEIEAGPDLDAACEIREYGALRVEMFTMVGATGTTRRAALSPDSVEPALTLHLDTVGSFGYEFADAELHGHARTIVFSETTQRFAQHASGGRAEKLLFSMPSAQVGVGTRWSPSVVPAALSSANPYAAVLLAHLRSLAHGIHHYPDGAWDDMSTTTIDLVKSVLESITSDENLLRDSQAATLARRVLLFVDHHATDPQLNATSIAAVHHISVRYLYAVLEREGVILGTYLRQRRVARATELLRRADHRHRTIAAVAHACGFYDHAHFSRAFRSVMGMTPSEWQRRDMRNR